MNTNKDQIIEALNEAKDEAETPRETMKNVTSKAISMTIAAAKKKLREEDNATLS